jgi:hypothetical protein
MQGLPLSKKNLPVADAILGIRDAKTANMFDILCCYRHATKNADADPDKFMAVLAAMDARNDWHILTKADEIATFICKSNF